MNARAWECEGSKRRSIHSTQHTDSTRRTAHGIQCVANRSAIYIQNIVSHFACYWYPCSVTINVPFSSNKDTPKSRFVNIRGNVDLQLPRPVMALIIWTKHEIDIKHNFTTLASPARPARQHIPYTMLTTSSGLLGPCAS